MKIFLYQYKNYLQVFQLREVNIDSYFNQEIIHYQEQPYYRKEYIISVDNPVNAKIFVIDDSEQSVMMESHEY